MGTEFSQVSSSLQGMDFIVSYIYSEIHHSPIILNATQKVLYLLILPDQRVERRKAMKCSAYANSIVQMGSLAAIVVKDKGADADKPGECGIYEEFPI